MTPIEFFKVDFQVIGLERDEDGAIVGEVPLAQGSVYDKGLDDFPDKVREIATDQKD